jgi:hypothetical protein
MSTLETIQVEWDRRVAVVTLSRSQARNALNTQLMLEVGSDLKSSGNDSSQIAVFSLPDSSIPTCTTLRTCCGTAHSGTRHAETPLKGVTLRGRLGRPPHVRPPARPYARCPTHCRTGRSELSSCCKSAEMEGEILSLRCNASGKTSTAFSRM